MSYKETLNLPQTDFAMKANLSQREPKMLEHWNSIDLYQQIRDKNKGLPKFILHDGPPYANGDIHLGHALNKVLKDIIIKSKTLSGFDAPYVPGWDCHGLPIEINVEKKVGKAGQKVSAKEFRQACREYAPKQIAGQKQDFIRLGIFGDWENPYLTMNFEFEANIVRALGKMIDKGHIYRGLKPVNWCCSCGSALAEAEVEYADKQSPAIDVAFPFVEADKVAQVFSCDIDTSLQTAVVIWTTTPWTLPANMAVSLHPEVDYTLLRCQPEALDAPIQLVIASELVDDAMQRYACESFDVLGTAKGAALENFALNHPWIERQVPVILGEHVTTDSGTGAVHTAPGHGVDDFIVAQRYDIDVINPVQANGVFDESVEHFAGQFVFKANDGVIELLQSKQLLMVHKPIQHSYPHCWRHKTPTIFRATPQWFVSMHKANLLEQSLQEIKKVQWMPERGQARIESMMESRPDWCISRQRSWGVPITVFYHKQTGDIHPKSLELLEQVATQIEQKGVDAWFDLSAQELLGDDAQMYEKATDILDVWFDSGASHFCVLSQREELESPADLYLEGSDQHRGWFQSSLLIGVAMNEQAPFKQVLTHGFTVDADGKKMSKSARNGVAPQKLIQQSGADILRLWVASTDYRDDVTVSDEVFKRTAEAYRRIRNTARFLLSNLNGFDPSEHMLPFNELLSLDQWAISGCAQLQEEIIEAYERYQFHLVYQKVQQFCSNELGRFYLSIIKDRLYTMQTDSQARRSAQTAMFHICEALVRWIAPLCPYTADEIWQSMMGERGVSVHLEQWYDQLTQLGDDDQEKNHGYWQLIQDVKQAVNKQVEEQRGKGVVKSELSAEIDLYCDSTLFENLSQLGDELRFVLLVSKVNLLPDDAQSANQAQASELEGLAVAVRASEHGKCDRCWHHHESVGIIEDHPELCQRCFGNINTQPEERKYA